MCVCFFKHKKIPARQPRQHTEGFGRSRYQIPKIPKRVFSKRLTSKKIFRESWETSHRGTIRRYVVGCLGFPYLKIKKCLGFLVWGFLAFVFWFLDYWLRKSVMLSTDVCYILPNSHVLFLIAIDPISKIFKNL